MRGRIVELQVEMPRGDLFLLVRVTPQVRPRWDPPDPGEPAAVELLRVTRQSGHAVDAEMEAWADAWLAENRDDIVDSGDEA
jgi:hypothetical protein